MDRPLLLSLGSINLDFQMRADRWPGPGETLLGTDFLVAGGGKAANVTYLAARLGAGTRLLARTGDDVLADWALRPLREAGVDLGGVRRLAGRTTGAALIIVRPDGDKTIVAAGNANDAWSEADGDEVDEAIAAAPAGSVLAADLAVPVWIVRRALEAARRREFQVVLDPSPAGRFEPDLYGMADYLTPNPTEAEQLTAVAVRSAGDGFRAGERLLERGVGAALVKLGGDGCAFSTGGTRAQLRAPSRKAVDATGAGDAFLGALAAALLERREPDDAVCRAVAAASLAVTGYGAQAAYPSPEELDRAAAEVVRVRRPAPPRSAGNPAGSPPSSAR